MFEISQELYDAIQKERQKADISDNPPLRRGEALKEIFDAFNSGGSELDLSHQEKLSIEEIDGEINVIIADSTKAYGADGRQ